MGAVQVRGARSAEAEKAEERGRQNTLAHHTHDERIHQRPITNKTNGKMLRQTPTALRPA